MSHISDIYNAMNVIAPFSLAEKWDNSGLLIGDMSDRTTKALLCLDVTDSIVDEAVEKKADLLISHHPLIFNPLKNISSKSIYARLLKNGIAVISAHTNFDMATGGINDIIAQKLELNITCDAIERVHQTPYYQLSVYVPDDYVEKVYEAMTKAGAGTLGDYSGCAFCAKGTGTFLPLEGSHAFIGEVGKREKVNETKIDMILPKGKRTAVIEAMQNAHPYEEPAYSLTENHAIYDSHGFGKTGNLNREYTGDEFAEKLKSIFGCTVIRYNDCKKPIKSVAICSGSGGSLLNEVIASGVDAFVTGDVKHDVFIDAQKAGLTVFDAGHYHTENIALESLRQRLSDSVDGVLFDIADNNRDILSYK